MFIRQILNTVFESLQFQAFITKKVQNGKYILPFLDVAFILDHEPAGSSKFYLKKDLEI